MKPKLTLSIFISTLALLTSCEKIGNSVVPSNNITEKNVVVSDFYGLDISDAFNVYVTFSDGSNSITVEANENLHEYIEVKNEGDRLSIGMKSNINIRRGSATLKVHITCSQLSSFDASGASNIYLHNLLRTKNAYIELSGASSITGSIAAEQLKADISGASNIKLDGTALSLEFDASGASNLMGYSLIAESFKANLSGASNAQLTVTEELRIEASGASNIYYKGNGVVKQQDLSGASNITKVN